MSLSTFWTLLILGLAIATSINYKVWWMWLITVVAMAIGVIFLHPVGSFAMMIIGLITPPLVGWSKRKPREANSVNTPGGPQSRQDGQPRR